MNTIQVLAEWALRSSILIMSGALLLWALRVRDASVRLAAWTAMLCGSLAMPLFTAMAPRMPVRVMHTVMRTVMSTTTHPAEAPVAGYAAAPEPVRKLARQGTNFSKLFDWARAAVMIYVLSAGALLLRLCFGLAMSLRLLRSSRATGRATEGIEIRESDRVAAPVTLGIARPAIVLPGDCANGMALNSMRFSLMSSRTSGAATRRCSCLGDSSGAAVAQPAELVPASAHRAGGGRSE